MNNQANIKDIEQLLKSETAFRENVEAVKVSARKRLKEIQELCNETRSEERHSKELLDKAKKWENICLLDLMAAAAAVAAQVPGAAEWYRAAKILYDAAVKNRKNMERRYAMAQQCVREANKLLADVNERFNREQRQLGAKTEEGSAEIKRGHGLAVEYSDGQTPKTELIKSYEVWRDRGARRSKTVAIDDVCKRISSNDQVMQGMLHSLYEGNKDFRNKADQVRAKLKLGVINEQEACNEILEASVAKYVQEAFSSYGEVQCDEMCKLTNDGNSLSLNVSIYELHNDVKLGNTEGLQAKKGEDLTLKLETCNMHGDNKELGILPPKEVFEENCLKFLKEEEAYV